MLATLWTYKFWIALAIIIILLSSPPIKMGLNEGEVNSIVNNAISEYELTIGGTGGYATPSLYDQDLNTFNDVQFVDTYLTENLYLDGILDMGPSGFRVSPTDTGASIRFEVGIGGDVTMSGTFSNDGSMVIGTDLFRVQSVANVVNVSAGILSVGDANNRMDTNSTGFTTLHGSARVGVDVPLDISFGKKGGANDPDSSDEDLFPTLDFDDAGDEEVFFTIHSPHDYATGTDIFIHLDFFVDAVDGATQRAVVWGAEYKVIEHGDVFDFGAGTTTILDFHEVPITVANKELMFCSDLNMSSIHLTNEGILIIRLYRDANHGEDDQAGDARVVHFHMHYQRENLGEIYSP